MPTVTVKASSRRTVLDVSDDGALVEFGPAGQNNQVGVMTLQITQSLGATWEAAVMGRVFGNAADTAPEMPFNPIPYRVGVLGNVAQIDPVTGQGWPWSNATLNSTEATIMIPANGLSIALQFTITNGFITVCGWDMNGCGAV